MPIFHLAVFLWINSFKKEKNKRASNQICDQTLFYLIRRIFIASSSQFHQTPAPFAGYNTLCKDHLTTNLFDRVLIL